MSEPLPDFVEEAIIEQEERATTQLQAILGRDDVTVRFDRSELLRPEKQERVWPDDFRGFGSNVRPRKS